jgi:hypothetical protein
VSLILHFFSPTFLFPLLLKGGDVRSLNNYLLVQQGSLTSIVRESANALKGLCCASSFSTHCFFLRVSFSVFDFLFLFFFVFAFLSRLSPSFSLPSRPLTGMNPSIQISNWNRSSSEDKNNNKEPTVDLLSLLPKAVQEIEKFSGMQLLPQVFVPSSSSSSSSASPSSSSSSSSSQSSSNK